jgi:hypothetical protein
MQQVVQRLQRLARLWDSAIRLPGGIAIGIDPLIGLVPGVGDAVGALVSGYIVLEAARLGVPAVTLLRMLLNIAIDALIGSIPVAGDLFDFAWKSNLRNVALVEHHFADPSRAVRASRSWLIVVIVSLVLLAALGIAAGWLVARALIRLV